MIPQNVRGAHDILANDVDAWALPHAERMVVYEHLERLARAEAEHELERLARSYKDTHEQYKEARDRIDLQTLQRATVIGMTTTKAAKYQAMLRRLEVKVVVIEEAAEVLEAHVLSCLSAATQHLILIGDHLQLRPKVEAFELTAASGQGYNLDVSLFERLALGGDLPIVQLKQQRRMRPEFADLIRLEVYTELQDHESCRHHPDIPGLRSNLWFLDHSELEDAAKEGGLDDGVSKSNKHEVAMVVGLVSHLLKQGYGPGQVTVLTPYLRQLFELRAALSRTVMTFTDDRDELALDLLQEEESEVKRKERGQQEHQRPAVRASMKDRVRMATIDNFQGEESEIIVISLVRSNEKGSIGFLRMANRVNVLLSRAKDGMYIIGNADTLTANTRDNIWPAVVDLLKERGQFGRAFPLVCSRHPDYQVDVANPADFNILAQNGGCTRPCDERLPCGHSCTLMCHSRWNREHLHVMCAMPCPRTCSRGHACQLECYKRCAPCKQQVPLPAPLPCGHHPATVLCHLVDTPDEVDCNHKVTVKAEGCAHEPRILACAEARKESANICPELCGTSLECGHRCPEKCGCCMAHNLAARTLADVDGDASAPECTQVCGQRLLCGHTCALPCHAATPALCDCSRPCIVACQHSHCGKPCGEVCVPCAMECDWDCNHQGRCAMPCAAPCNRPPCDMPCTRKLACGHPCPPICGEKCPSRTHCPTCATDEVKGRMVDLVMMTTLGEHDYRDEPLLVLECGHIYTVSTLDAHVGLSNFYTHAQDSSLRPAPLESEFKHAPVCPECRGSLASVRRYGRPIKKALVSSNQEGAGRECAEEVLASLPCTVA